MPSGASVKTPARPPRFDPTRGEPASSSVPAATYGRSATKTDALYIPLTIFFAFVALNMLTLTGAHTFDSLAYIRDMGKPLAALVLPHHLMFEPLVYAFDSAWILFGWQGDASMPAQVLCSLAGAGGLAVYYKLASELGTPRIAALLATVALGLSYGYWFYSVEVDIYLPPLFFLLLAAWLLMRAWRLDSLPLLALVGLSHTTAVLLHQAAIFLVPAFALGVLSLGDAAATRVRRLLTYVVPFGLIVGLGYFVGGVVIAGRNSVDEFAAWANSYGNLGTWGGFRNDTLDATVSGVSAAMSAEFWTGRLLVAALLVLCLVRVPHTLRQGGPLAVTLWLWVATYALFFAWWQPEVLKFWLLVLAPLSLLALLSFRWRTLPLAYQRLALASAAACILLLAVTNAPTVWAKRDPMDDPFRRESDALARLTGPEDLIVLQAGTAELQLPYYYKRINVLSTRELWYLMGGEGGRDAAVDAILQRSWHALAKGANVWIEDRVATPGTQAGDHYVFTSAEIDRILSPYGTESAIQDVQVGPATFRELSPDRVYSKQTEWQFERDQEGWSGVNVANERVGGGQGWCFSPLDDPNLYGPPMQLPTGSISGVEISMTSATDGKAQLFYRSDPGKPYSEEQSVLFPIKRGTGIYSVPLAGAPGWSGVISGLRFDPVEHGDPSSGTDNNICIAALRLVRTPGLFTNSGAPKQR